jgi:hypothetical protein
MIENTGSPGGNGMAECTLRSRGWKPSGDMVRYVPAHGGGALEGGLVAAITIRRIERVVVAFMAGGTGCRRRRHVRPSQSKRCDAMVERHSVPIHSRVASGTICRPERGPGRGVRRIICLLPGR